MPKPSQQSYRYRGTSLSVGEGVVVTGEVVAAGSGKGLELMVRDGISEMLSGSSQGVIELIVRVIHLVYLKHIFQTPPRRTGYYAPPAEDP